MAELIGAPWCIAMGDDSVEGYVAGAVDRYQALGHTCKDYIPCLTNPDGSLGKVNFCSHELSQNSFWLTSWPKTLFKYLSTPQRDFHDLEAELGLVPEWPRIRSWVTRETPGDKINGQETEIFNPSISRNERACPTDRSRSSPHTFYAKCGQFLREWTLGWQTSDGSRSSGSNPW